MLKIKPIKPISIKVAFLFALIIGLSACGKGNQSADQHSQGKSLTTVRLAVDTATGGGLQFRVAKAKGIFEKYGINAELSNFPKGIDTVNAMLINQTDTATGADFALVNALTRSDFLIVSTLGRSNKISTSRTILFSKDNIKSPRDLKGKKLGLAVGTVYEYIWHKYLEKNNIAADDVKFVPFSTFDEAIVALNQGDMDAVWVGGSLSDKFDQLKNIHHLATQADAGVGVSTFFVVDRAWAEKNAKAVENILLALNESSAYLSQHDQEVADIAYKEIKLPKDSVIQDIKYSNYVIGFNEEDYQQLSNIKDWVDNRSNGKGVYHLKDKIDVQYLKNVLPDAVNYQ